VSFLPLLPKNFMICVAIVGQKYEYVVSFIGNVQQKHCPFDGHVSNGVYNYSYLTLEQLQTCSNQNNTAREAHSELGMMNLDPPKQEKIRKHRASRSVQIKVAPPC